MRFYKTPQILKKWFSGFTWDIAQADKVIYLTFDDGPIPEVTEFVLATLATFAAKGTFFCVGDNIRKHPGVFKQILAAGHSLGNHTFNHLKGWSTPTSQYLENVALCRQVMLENGVDLPPKPLFRPPYGRITTRQFKVLQPDYQIIMWDMLTNDYDKSLDQEVCLRKAIQYSQSGSIVVFHDSLKAEKNLRYVLPRYLAHFTALGYRFEGL
ncbi:MAG: polysaccharide deacetylase family protein [Microscillaceae bacterium]|nr:polysaccharide deacetylase family protein [Microscillaceae bacterium]